MVNIPLHGEPGASYVTGDTLFCEDCYGWVSNAAPTITNANL